MAIKSSDQISIVDITDAYSVILSNESHTFLGTTNTAKSGSTTTTIYAMLGAEQVAATVNVNSITKPTGVAISSDNNATSPTLTISVTTAVTTGGKITIPVKISTATGDIVTINKDFTYAIAFTGAKGDKGATGSAGRGITGVTEHYLATTASSGVTSTTNGWTTTIQTMTESKKYLWNYETISYSDSTTSDTTPCIIGVYGTKGATGNTGATGKGIKSITEYYLASSSSSGVTTSTDGWSTSMQTTSTSKKYLWNYSKIKYTDDSTENSSVRIIGTHGATGAAGADAIAISIESSNGTIFKNTAVTTVLTARVFKGAKEVTGDALTALGTIKWYKNGGTTSIATGQTLTISAGDVTNSATFVAQLEA